MSALLRRLVGVALAVVLVISLAACAAPGSNAPSSSTPSNTSGGVQNEEASESDALDTTEEESVEESMNATETGLPTTGGAEGSGTTSP